MKPAIIREKISPADLARITKENYGNMVKIDVDIEREILTIGGEWHSEGDELLSEEDGYKSTNVWGCNFYPWNPPEKRIVFTSLINLKPSIGHRNMEVQDDQIKERMKGIIRSLLLDDNETLDV